ncbi:MAG: NYN domain-containing protein [Patescibacteria group bacterium]
MTKAKENNYAFIDSQNLNLSIQEQGWNLDFGRFGRYIEDRFFVTKAFLFIGFVYEHQTMYTYLQKAGYILVFKPTLILPNEKVKGNVDADLVLHAMIEYPRYDKAVIVTGDGDFHCLVEYLEKKNKLERLVVPNKYKYSSLLRRFSHWITFLNGTKEKLGRNFEMKKRHSLGTNPSGSLLS